jgi:hypothetical protein
MASGDPLAFGRVQAPERACEPSSTHYQRANSVVPPLAEMRPYAEFHKSGQRPALWERQNRTEHPRSRTAKRGSCREHRDRYGGVQAASHRPRHPVWRSHLLLFNTQSGVRGSRCHSCSIAFARIAVGLSRATDLSDRAGNGNACWIVMAFCPICGCYFKRSDKAANCESPTVPSTPLPWPPPHPHPARACFSYAASLMDFRRNRAAILSAVRSYCLTCPHVTLLRGYLVTRAY